MNRTPRHWVAACARVLQEEAADIDPENARVFARSAMWGIGIGITLARLNPEEATRLYDAMNEVVESGSGSSERAQRMHMYNVAQRILRDAP